MLALNLFKIFFRFFIAAVFIAAVRFFPVLFQVLSRLCGISKVNLSDFPFMICSAALSVIKFRFIAGLAATVPMILPQPQRKKPLRVIPQLK
jgi:hypothetical protein